MKYLKTFEKLLQFNDPDVINNPLFNFSKKLEYVLFKVKELDNIEHKKKSKVNRYFNNNGDIRISYLDNSWLFKFKILQYDNDVILITNYHKRTNNIDNNSIELFNFIKEELSNYIDSNNNYTKTYESYRFPMTDLDNIIEKFEKYKDFLEIKFNAIKYNI